MRFLLPACHIKTACRMRVQQIQRGLYCRVEEKKGRGRGATGGWEAYRDVPDEEV